MRKWAKAAGDPPGPPRSDLGSPAIPVVVELIAVGTVGAVERARRRHTLPRIAGMTPALLRAARLYQLAHDHMGAGRGMGSGGSLEDDGPRSVGVLLPQERALAAAEMYRRGAAAMGQVAASGVVRWVVLEGRSLSAWDAMLRQREGTGARHLLLALHRLAAAYGV